MGDRHATRNSAILNHAAAAQQLQQQQQLYRQRNATGASGTYSFDPLAAVMFGRGGGSGVPSSLAQFHDVASAVIEVHDSQLKAPLSVPLSAIQPTTGFDRAVQSLNAPHHNRQRHIARLCEGFAAVGSCPLGATCGDVHVRGEVWERLREEMLGWIRDRETAFASLAPDATFRVYCADIKEIIDVPAAALAFTRGLYLDPSLRAKRSHATHQPSPFAVLTSLVPTACGLYSASPMSCRWGRFCNQAHIDGGWMRQRRVDFEVWSHELEAHFAQLPATHTFLLHDPETKLSLAVSKALVAEFSRGLFQGSQLKAPSICMLYQRGRCTAGSCCNQVHVAPTTLAALRANVVHGVQQAQRHMQHHQGHHSAAAGAAGAAGLALSHPHQLQHGSVPKSLTPPPPSRPPAYSSSPSTQSPQPSPNLGPAPTPKPGLAHLAMLHQQQQQQLLRRELNPQAQPFSPPVAPQMVEANAVFRTGPSPEPSEPPRRGLPPSESSEWDVTADAELPRAAGSPGSRSAGGAIGAKSQHLHVVPQGTSGAASNSSPVREMLTSERNAASWRVPSPLSPNQCRLVFQGFAGPAATAPATVEAPDSAAAAAAAASNSQNRPPSGCAAPGGVPLARMNSASSDVLYNSDDESLTTLGGGSSVGAETTAAMPRTVPLSAAIGAAPGPQHVTTATPPKGSTALDWDEDISGVLGPALADDLRSLRD